ncbi:MAG: hypothetical protein LBP85_03270 [Prevotellaceae bacterium]|jgi:virulence-associated protein VapD|nr:hypothetical protein [Prevotellaceae bacterium]
MADTEKTVLVKADIITNFVSTKKELDNVKKGYDDLSELLEKIAAEQEKNSEAYKKTNAQLAAQAIKLANANNEYKLFQKIKLFEHFAKVPYSKIKFVIYRNVDYLC